MGQVIEDKLDIGNYSLDIVGLHVAARFFRITQTIGISEKIFT
jgi:hypothetical protein